MDTTRDPLDELLDSTAPPGVDRTPRVRLELARMSSSARRAARPPLRRRPLRVAVGVGLAALLVGGTGTAVAVSTFDWAPWADQADIVYPFTLPSGRECEARVQVLQVVSTDENGMIETAPDAELTGHFRSIDAIGRIDMPAAIAHVRTLENANVVVHPDGSMSDVPRSLATMTEDDVYAFAVNRALGAVLHGEFDALGWSDDDWSTNMDVLCVPVAP